jgi:hypothetical protein
MSVLALRALTSLGRMRRVETDEARRDLAEALGQETALAERDGAILRQVQEARLITGDFDRNAFSAWLGRLGIERARLAAAMREAEARTASARLVLANRRVAETAAEDALAEAVAVRGAETERKDQVMLEDVARALSRNRGPGR